MLSPLLNWSFVTALWSIPTSPPSRSIRSSSSDVQQRGAIAHGFSAICRRVRRMSANNHGHRRRNPSSAHSRCLQSLVIWKEPRVILATGSPSEFSAITYTTLRLREGGRNPVISLNRDRARNPVASSRPQVSEFKSGVRVLSKPASLIGQAASGLWLGCDVSHDLCPDAKRITRQVGHRKILNLDGFQRRGLSSSL